MSLTWEDPTPRQRGKAHVFTDEDRALLRANPGRWALTAAKAASSAAHWKRRWGADGFEFATRGHAPNVKVYARYVGIDGDAR